MRLPRPTLAAILSCAFALPEAHISFKNKAGSLFANDVPFLVKGAIWQGAAGPNDAPDGLIGPHAHKIDDYMELLSRGGFNAIRLEFNHHSILNPKQIRHFSANVEPALRDKNYLQALQILAQKAGKRGILIALACTQLTPTSRPGNGLWHNTEVTEEDSLRSWAKIAHTFCEQGNVFAVDLFEEPHGSTWGFGPSHLDWHAAAQRIGRYVQGVCPRWLIMVQGARSVPWTQSVPELTPGQNLMGVHQKQIHLEDNSKLIYAPHVASPTEHMMVAYQDDAFPGNMPPIWGRQFGFVTELTGASLILGRVGGLLADALDNAWQKAIFGWAHDRNLGFFYDCLNPNPSSGGLLHKDWGSLRAEKIALLSELVGTPLSRYTCYTRREDAFLGAPPVAFSCIPIASSNLIPYLRPRANPSSSVRRVCCVRSLPPPPPRKPFRPKYNGMLTPKPPKPLETESTTLVCLSNVRAIRLRGSLDMQSGTQSSSTLLSIYSPTTWSHQVAEVAASARDHSILHLKAGDSAAVKFNRTMCFPVPDEPHPGEADSASVNLCFQISDLTTNGRVRFANRGCGELRPEVQEYTFPLNDGGAITMHGKVTDKRLHLFGTTVHVPSPIQKALETLGLEPASPATPGSSTSQQSLALIITAVVVVPLIALALLWSLREPLSRRFPALAQQVSGLRKQALLTAARVAYMLGLSSIAVELSQAAAKRHTRLPTTDAPTSLAMRPRARIGSAETSNQLRTGDDLSGAEEENAMKMALQLLQRDDVPRAQANQPEDAALASHSGFPPPPAAGGAVPCLNPPQDAPQSSPRDAAIPTRLSPRSTPRTAPPACQPQQAVPPLPVLPGSGTAEYEQSEVDEPLVLQTAGLQSGGPTLRDNVVQSPPPRVTPTASALQSPREVDSACGSSSEASFGAIMDRVPPPESPAPAPAPPPPRPRVSDRKPPWPQASLD